jgi:hypothetical protein
MAVRPIPEERAPLLTVNNAEIIYEHVILVSRGVSLSVPEGASSLCLERTAPETRKWHSTYE